MTEILAAPVEPGPQAVPVDPNPTYVPDPATGRPAGDPPATPPAEPEPAKPEKPASIDDAVKKAFDKAQEKAKAKEVGEQPKVEAKPEPKAERGVDGKSQPKAPVEGAEAQAGEQPKPAPRSDAPSRFRDPAKAEWANAPESVRDETTRAIQELERGIEKYRESHQRYENIREFDDRVRQTGGDLRRTLEKVSAVITATHTDPVAGLDMLLREIGPRKQDGSPYTLFEVAHHVVNQNPDHRAAQQSSTIASLQAKISQMEQMVAQTNGFVQEQRFAPAVSAIQEFAAKNPRYSEFQTEIASVLKSGLIPSSLPIAERLDRAYKTVIFNVDGEIPSAHTASVPATNGAHTAPAPVKTAGQKSVSGAPSAVTAPANTAKGPAPSIDEALQRALRKAS